MKTNRKSRSAGIDEISSETDVGALRAAIWPHSAREQASEGPGNGEIALREFRVVPERGSRTMAERRNGGATEWPTDRNSHK